MSWNPVTLTLGDLPLKAGEQKVYPVPVPANSASQLLVYAFISLEDSAQSFHRGFYDINTQTTDGTKYSFYMNVAMNKDTVINSANFWLPFGPDFQPYVYITLNGADNTEIKPKKKVKSCSGKDGATALKDYCSQRASDDEQAVGQAFIIGYK